MKNTAITVSLLALLGSGYSTDAVHAAEEGVAESRKIILAVDGLSYDLLEKARSQGLFSGLVSQGRQIAPYPSFSDLAWSEALGTSRVSERLGAPVAPEARYFDPSTQAVSDDPRNSLGQLFRPLGYHRAFDVDTSIYDAFNPLPRVSPELEMKRTEERIAAGLGGAADRQLIAYVNRLSESSSEQELNDSVRALSGLVERLQAKYGKASPPLEIVLLSESGGGGRPSRQPVEPAQLLQGSGFEMATQLRSDNQVAIVSTPGNSAASVSFRDLSKRPGFAEFLAKSPAVDLVSYVERTGNPPFVRVLGPEGAEARIFWGPKGLAYQPVRGNPLGVDSKLVSDSTLRWYSEKEFLQATASGKYPDAVNRLVEAARSPMVNRPDLFFDLKSQYAMAGSQRGRLPYLAGQGALSRDASTGVIASTRSQVPLAVPGRKVLETLKLEPEALFRRTRPQTRASAELSRIGGGGAVASMDTSSDPTQPKAYRALRASYIEDDGVVDPRQPSTTVIDPALLTDPIRQRVMKWWSKPYAAIEEYLAVPSMDKPERDPRDREFLKQWIGGKRAAYASCKTRLQDDPGLARRLFQEIFQERKLAQDTAPFAVPLAFNPELKDVTVVFVPGLYNEFFDQGIFSRGLRAAREELGARTLYVDVDGRCASPINAKKILQQLKEDSARRVQRGESKPKYLILGYSKGGLDSTEMLLEDREFARSQVAGLVSIASPHHGTSIIEKADMPGILTETTVSRPLAEECRRNPAANSLTRASREKFWKEHASELKDLTRFYSVAMKSTVLKSHPWMQATKLIGQFPGDNDGVVPLESARFPAELGATELATIDADHLDGISSSRFPQEALIEAVLLTLQETASLDEKCLKVAPPARAPAGGWSAQDRSVENACSLRQEGPGVPIPEAEALSREFQMLDP